MNRDIFFTNLQNEIRINKKLIPSGGLLQIICNKIPKPLARNYEVNYLMYKATNQANWWSSIDDHIDTSFNIPNSIINNINYQKKYIYIHNTKYYQYKTFIYMSVINYDGFKNSFKNVLFNSKNSKIKINKILVKSN